MLHAPSCMLCIISSATHSQGVNVLHTDCTVLLELKPFVRVDASKYTAIRPLKDFEFCHKSNSLSNANVVIQQRPECLIGEKYWFCQ